MIAIVKIFTCITAATGIAESPFPFANAFTSQPAPRHTTHLHSESSSRRTFLSTITTASLLTLSPIQPSHADDTSLLSDLTTSLDKLQSIPPLLQNQEWDKVRTILKTPPVNTLWNLGDSTNPLVRLAKSSGNMELMELKDDLSISLQMTDQYSYDNVFIYYQPGNGKVKIKEPLEMCEKAIGELREAIDLAKQ